MYPQGKYELRKTPCGLVELRRTEGPPAPKAPADLVLGGGRRHVARATQDSRSPSGPAVQIVEARTSENHRRHPWGGASLPSGRRGSGANPIGIGGPPPNRPGAFGQHRGSWAADSWQRSPSGLGSRNPLGTGLVRLRGIESFASHRCLRDPFTSNPAAARTG